MTQNTKNLLMIGGVAVVGYLIYKQMSKPKNFANYVDDDFFNVSGTRKARMSSPRGGGSCSSGDNTPSCNLCGQSCMNGICYFAIYDKDGNIGSYQQATCGGAGTQIGRGK
jgi:hypothetical protein